ncbi:MAG: hypothetical protein ACRDDH_18025 [Cetobacterium sp.]|uniref:hypothetical protein n=1 Tax=Cetobacterium sp. TaxID=2071632 RepID=UPI003EE5BEC8
MDKITAEYLKNIYVWLPCRVEEVGEDSLLKVQPLVYNEGLPLPIINDVPVEHIGNEKAFINIKVNKGDIGICIFSQMDMAEFMETGEMDSCETHETFNLTNCSFLPLKKWNKVGTVMPSTYDFEIVGNVFHKGNWVHDGELERTGNSKIIGNTEQTGDMTITGKLVADVVNAATQLLIKGIDFILHKHSGVTGGKDQSGGVS